MRSQHEMCCVIEAAPQINARVLESAEGSPSYRLELKSLRLADRSLEVVILLVEIGGMSIRWKDHDVIVRRQPNCPNHPLLVWTLRCAMQHLREQDSTSLPIPRSSYTNQFLQMQWHTPLYMDAPTQIVQCHQVPRDPQAKLLRGNVSHNEMNACRKFLVRKPRQTVGPMDALMLWRRGSGLNVAVALMLFRHGANDHRYVESSQRRNAPAAQYWKYVELYAEMNGLGRSEQTARTHGRTANRL